MPTFDLILLLQKMEMPALRAALKRNAQYIFNVGGTIREMENLGCRELPYRIHLSGQPHRQAHYFVLKYDASYEMRDALKTHLNLDRDVLRACNFRVAKDPFELHAPKPKQECTIYEDDLPPPLRPVIIEMHKRLHEKKEKEKAEEKFPLKNIDDQRFLI